MSRDNRGNPGSEALAQRSAAVTATAAEAAAKLRLSDDAQVKMEAMHAAAKKEANQCARDITDPQTIEGSQFRRGFLARVAKKVNEWNATAPVAERIPTEPDANRQFSPAYLNFMQKMFNEEILNRAQNIEIKESKDNEANQAAKQAVRKGRQEFHKYSGASTIVATLRDVAVTPTNLAAGFAEFLNENAPDGHKDEFLLLVTLCHGATTVIEFFFDAVKSVLDTLALKNAPPKEAEGYKKYLAQTEEARTQLKNKKISPKAFNDADDKAKRDLKNLVNADAELGTGSGQGSPGHVPSY